MGREGGRWRVKGERWQAIKRPINLLNECSSCGGFSETCILLPGSSLSASSSHTHTHSHAIPTHSYNHTPFSVAATSDTHLHTHPLPPHHYTSHALTLTDTNSHTLVFSQTLLTHFPLHIHLPHTYTHTHTHTLPPRKVVHVELIESAKCACVYSCCSFSLFSFSFPLYMTIL